MKDTVQSSVNIFIVVVKLDSVVIKTTINTIFLVYVS